MKNCVSGLRRNELVVPSEAWREERNERLLEIGHLSEKVDTSGSGNRKAAATTDEGCRGLGPGGSREARVVTGVNQD